MTLKKSINQIQILFIGSNNIRCRMLRKILKGTYYKLFYAHSKTAALAVLKQEKPDILICDESITNLDMYEFCGFTKSQPELKNRVFERFAQAEPIHMRGNEGTGPGLSIAKTFVEQLGGKIDFKTEISKGSTFYIDLPLWEE